MQTPKEFLWPVPVKYVILTLFLALVLEMLPLDHGQWQWQPDFVAMMVLYWCINSPRLFGGFAAFFMGVLTDIASTSLIGQHALSYSIIAYLAGIRQRQVVMYSVLQQAVLVFALLMLNQAVMLVTRMALGASFFGWGYFASPLPAALLWPFLSMLLTLPQRRVQAG